MGQCDGVEREKVGDIHRMTTCGENMSVGNRNKKSVSNAPTSLSLYASLNPVPCLCVDTFTTAPLLGKNHAISANHTVIREAQVTTRASFRRRGREMTAGGREKSI